MPPQGTFGEMFLVFINMREEEEELTGIRWLEARDALNMPVNLENSAVATGLESVSFHSNPKESQCQRMLKLSFLRGLFSGCGGFSCC